MGPVGREGSVALAFIRALFVEGTLQNFHQTVQFGEVTRLRVADRDFGEVQRLLKVLSRPFDESDAATRERYAGFPPEWAQSIEVSCSS